MICPNCNKEIKDDSKFCIFCGANVQSQSNARNDVKQCAECSAAGKYSAV